MSKICSVCGYQCEEEIGFCPVCGSPFPTSSQSVVPSQAVPPTQVNSAIQTQAPTPTVPPISPQPVIPSQTDSGMQSQPAPYMQTPGMQPQPAPFTQTNPGMQPQPASFTQNNPGMQSQPASFTQNNPGMQPQPAYAVYPQNPVMQGQNIQGNATPPKKKSKVLWIVLGIVGGILLLLIIILVLLMFGLKQLWGSRNIPSLNTSSAITHSDSHEYYYPDYDSASFHSEAFVDVTTEEILPPEEPSDIISAMEFKEEDLIICSVQEGDAEPPLQYHIEENYTYTIQDSNGFLQTGNGISQIPAGFEEKQCHLGRNIGIGNSFDQLITTYGIDTTNAMWQIQDNGNYEYYYYSTEIKPDWAGGTVLVTAWCRTGDTWQRMYPSDLFTFWQNGTLPECDTVLMYMVHMDSTVDNIEAIDILYGNANYFETILTERNTPQENSTEPETE